MPTLDRGFKAWSERTARSIRQTLGIAPAGVLTVAQLAAHLDVELLTPSDLPGLPAEFLNQLLNVDPWGWSAVTVNSEDGCVVVYNPMKSAGRQASDIMHELAHVLLAHRPGTIILSQDGEMGMRSFDQKQEDEANWLAWALLLPREALMHARRTGLEAHEIAEKYGVTETLVRFRKSMTGVDRQLRR
jgi:hypothetical protein